MSRDIYIRAISQEMPQLSTTKIHLKITYLKFHSNFPGANELRIWILLISLGSLWGRVSKNCLLHIGILDRTHTVIWIIICRHLFAEGCSVCEVEIYTQNNYMHVIFLQVLNWRLGKKRTKKHPAVWSVSFIGENIVILNPINPILQLWWFLYLSFQVSWVGSKSHHVVWLLTGKSCFGNLFLLHRVCFEAER